MLKRDGYIYIEMYDEDDDDVAFVEIVISCFWTLNLNVLIFFLIFLGMKKDAVFV